MIFLISFIGALLDVHVEGNARKSLVMRIFLCFSLYTNGKKLLGTKKVEGNIDCLNGIRFFSMSWVVLGHSWYIISLTPWTNQLAVNYVSLLLLGNLVAKSDLFIYFFSNFRCLVILVL